MKYFRSVLLLLAMGMFLSCNSKSGKVNPPPPPPAPTNENPPADGFDLENSDEAAMDIADEVMKAMGGRANWDQTRFHRVELFWSASPDLG